MKNICFLLVPSFLLLVSCGSATQENKDPTLKNNQTINTTPVSSKAAIGLTIDGKTRTISLEERISDTFDFAAQPIKTMFRKSGEDRQFEINLNIYDPKILSELPATFSIPEANMPPHVAIDLNFFDFERKVEKSMRKRLIFEKGTITIHEFSKEKIRFEFEGEAHELMNTEGRSKVSGWVEV